MYIIYTCVSYLKRKHRENNFSLVKMERELKRERQVEHCEKLVIFFFAYCIPSSWSLFLHNQEVMKVKSEFFYGLMRKLKEGKNSNHIFFLYVL